MNFHPYVIKNKQFEVEVTHIYYLESKDGSTFTFQPGQWVFLKDQHFAKPNELHPFSIASSPLQKEGIELCIKEYGDWTHNFSMKPIGSEVFVSEPQGEFTWDPTKDYAVFLLGGIGISPIMSMLRTLADKKDTARIVMLYGNRTPDTIAYKKELEELTKSLPNFSVVHIFSHIDESHPWRGHRGFITKDIVEREVELGKNPMFYFIGPPIFIEKMHVLLRELHVDEAYIKTESLEEK